MGIIICPQHGSSGFQEVCRHVDAEFKSGNYREFYSLYFWHDVLVCDDCLNAYDLDRFENYPGFIGKRFWEIEDKEEESLIYQESQQAYSNLQRRAWCVECLVELRGNRHRREVN